MDIGDLRVMGKTADESCPLQAAAIVFSTWRKRHVRSVCYLHKHFGITFLPVARIFKSRKEGFLASI